MNVPPNIPQFLLAQALDESCDGITIADVQQHGLPLIYANRGFEKMTGFALEEVIGKNYRVILQGADTKQPEIAQIRSAIASGKSFAATLRNYRKDGSMFWNRLSIFPVHDAAGKLTHYIGIQKDVTDGILLEEQINNSSSTDALVGLSNRRHFEERLADLLAISRRIYSGMSVLLINMDHFRQFNERYGQPAGDDCLRAVGNCIKKLFVRTSDCMARFGGDEFSIVSFSSGSEALRRHAQKLCENVSLLNIPHEDSPYGKITVSVGGVHRFANRDTSAEVLIDQARKELLAAKNGGRNCARIIG